MGACSRHAIAIPFEDRDDGPWQPDRALTSPMSIGIRATAGRRQQAGSVRALAHHRPQLLNRASGGQADEAILRGWRNAWNEKEDYDWKWVRVV